MSKSEAPATSAAAARLALVHAGVAARLPAAGPRRRHMVPDALAARARRNLRLMPRLTRLARLPRLPRRLVRVRRARVRHRVRVHRTRLPRVRRLAFRVLAAAAEI